MYTKLRSIFPILLGLLFSILFINEGIGINLLIFEILLFSACYKQIVKLNRVGKWIGVFVVLSLFLVILQHTSLSICIHLIFAFVFAGSIAGVNIPSVYDSFVVALNNSVLSFQNWNQSVKTDKTGVKKVRPKFRILKLTVFPVSIAWIFGFLYSKASPWFGDLSESVLGNIGRFFEKIGTFFSLEQMSLFILGVTISCLYVFSTSTKNAKQIMEQKELIRKRVRKFVVGMEKGSLINEYKIGVMVFISLNLLLLLVNVLDIYWVWFQFEWDGRFLKQLVHEGTYVLIFTIVLSAGLVLYFFRGNQHFLNRVWLKRLTVLWIAQNVLLAISVAVRNWRYAEHFALAFKRIGVFYFLAFAICTLLFLVIFVIRQKTIPYLLKHGSFTTMIILFMLAVPNWNIVIAKYNFKHADSAFVELEFMSSLDDTALPFLEPSNEFMQAFKINQHKLFRFKQDYMDEATYLKLIKERKIALSTKEKHGTWLSWNLADDLLNKRLKD